MEIKHTVEILTKDIQEIEKLVRNLNNSPIPPKIELDLALSKLRNVYELLSMIRSDIEKDVNLGTAANEEEIKVAKPAEAIAVSEEPKEHISVSAEPEIIADPEPVKIEITQEEIVQIEELVPEPPKKKKEAAILAEKFNNDTSINDNIASSVKQGNVTSKISGQPIENIGRNIGINDRFLIIRELFDGNNANYSQLIKELDASTNANDAIKLLESTFPEDTEHEGYQLLTQLAQRKFMQK